MAITINDLLLKMQNEYGNKIGFQWFDCDNECVKSKTYFEFVNDTRKFVSYLQNIIGDNTDAHMAFYATKSYHYSVALFACLQMGVVVIPFNNGDSKEVIKYQFELADIDYIIYDDMIPDFISDFDGKTMINIEGYVDYPESMTTYCFDYFNKPAVMVFTSGTTGVSKCVMLSLNNIFSFLSYLEDWTVTLEAELGRTIESALHILPLYHIAGIATMFGWAAMFKTINLCCDMKSIVRDVNVMDSDFTVVVPMILQVWAKMLHRGLNSCIGKLCTISCVGATLDEKTVQLFSKHVKSLSGGYSLTEICAAGLWNCYYLTNNYNSLGKPGKGVEVKIIDGEICIKSDALMLGYYKNESETNNTIKDGWIYTGDLGYIDDSGYVYLTGRKKNLIILSNGENVSPEELENLIYKNPYCQEVIVKVKNNKISAEIYCDEDKQNDVKSYILEMNGNLPLYKHIINIDFRITPFDKNGSGKIVR